MTEPDPIAEAFRTYQKAPKDVVPQQNNDDSRPLPTGPQPVTWHEITDQGITTHTENTEITKPIGGQHE